MAIGPVRPKINTVIEAKMEPRGWGRGGEWWEGENDITQYNRHHAGVEGELVDGVAELSQALLLFPLFWPPLREQLSGSGFLRVATIYEMFTIIHLLPELLQLIFNITSSQKKNK